MRIIALMVLCMPLLNCMEQEKALAVKMGGYSSYGRKETQEDRVDLRRKRDPFGNTLFCTGVFDGHGGDAVAAYLKEMFLNNVFSGIRDGDGIEHSLRVACDECDDEVSWEDSLVCSGSTLLASCFDSSTKKLHLIWVGDSKGYCGDSYGYFISTMQHRPTDENEKKRIEKVGGKIDQHGRVNGKLAVSRSIGDAFAKRNLVLAGSIIATPSYSEYQLGEKGGYYIGASDGFSDAVKDEEFTELFMQAVLLSKKSFYAQYPLSESYESDSSSSVSSRSGDDDYSEGYEDKDAIVIAKRLVRIAKSRGARDNITVVVQLFGDELKLFSQDGSGSENSDICSSSESGEGSFNNTDIDSSLLALASMQAQANETKVVNVVIEPEKTLPVEPEQLHEPSVSVNVDDIVRALAKVEDRADKLSKSMADEKDQESVKLAPQSSWRTIHYMLGGGFAVVLIAVLVGCYYKKLGVNYMMG